jgi:hypothetical protein
MLVAISTPYRKLGLLWQLKAAFALPLDAAEREVFHTVAGDREPPSRRVRELWCVIGRGGGKSRMAAALGDALFQKHRLSAGERGHVARPGRERRPGAHGVWTLDQDDAGDN